jgi:hypothetical protein
MTRFAIEKVEDELTGRGLRFQRAGEVLEFPNPGGVTRLTLSQCDRPTQDGERVIAVATVSHEIPELRDDRNPTLVHRWNKYASMCGLVTGIHSGVPSVQARFQLLEGDEGAASGLYPYWAAGSIFMAGAAAYFLKPGSPCAADFFAGLEVPGPEYFGLKDTAGQPCRLGQDAFEDALQWAHSRSLRCQRQSSGFSVEFPWGNSGRTTLFSLTTAETHPLFGNGCMVTLSLPDFIADGEQSQLLEDLNRWEARDDDLVPTVGAWASVTWDTLGWVTFVPNAFCYPRMARQMLVWASVRSDRAWAFREDRGP